MLQTDIAANPFTPSFGRVPPILAGRKVLLAEMARAFSTGTSDPNLCTILIGTRGSGKTALLVHLAREAQPFGWVSASVSAMPGMLEDIVERSIDAADQFVEREAPARLKSLSVGQLFGVEWEYRNASSGNWRTRMNRLLDRLAEYDIGLLITVDEVVADSDELKQLVSVFQHFGSEGRKVALLMAGLPGNVSALLEDRSVSFLLRATQRELEFLNDRDVSSALRKTVEDSGKRIDDDALDLAVKGIGGFPYLMQLVGFYSWDASSGASVITYDHVAAGIETSRKEFSNGVLKRVYAALSTQDKAFLRAMAQDEGPSFVGEVAKRMGKSESYARVYRRRLVKHGAIVVPGRNEVAFALPLMREFLLETSG